MLIPQKCNNHSILIMLPFIRPGNKRTLRIRTHEHQAVIPTCTEPLLPKGCSFLNKQMCGDAK